MPAFIIGGNRQATGERLDQHQTERIRFRREDEDVARAVMLGKLLAELRTGEMHMRIRSFQFLKLRAAADHQLEKRNVHVEKSLDVFLDGHPPDINRDRQGLVGEQRLRAGMEYIGVDAAGEAV